jgi:ketol-acid reductoisomerase
VEEGMQICKDITVIMCAQNVRDLKFVRNIKEGLVPTLIAVHPENDPKEEGFEQAKAYAVATEDIKEF